MVLIHAGLNRVQDFTFISLKYFQCRKFPANLRNKNRMSLLWNLIVFHLKLKTKIGHWLNYRIRIAVPPKKRLLGRMGFLQLHSNRCLLVVVNLLRVISPRRRKVGRAERRKLVNLVSYVASLCLTTILS